MVLEFERKWLRAVDVPRKLIGVSECLCRNINIKHPEQQFEQTFKC
jgi:hypothetical protein